MKSYIIYETDTGKIVSTLRINPIDIDSQNLVGRTYIEGDLGIQQIKDSYIVNNEVVARPIQNTVINKTILLADGTDEIIISNAPSNAKFIAYNDTTNEILECNIDCSDTFTTNIPGTIRIEIIKFPYLNYGVTIYAN
jgi:hypothetical protein